MSITWSARINRESVLLAIGVTTQKIPVDMDKTFTNVTIMKRDYETSQDDRGRTTYRWKFTEPQLVDVTLIVRPLKRRTYLYYGEERIAKSSKHRTFIVCPRCHAEIPTGRFHQHINTKVCNEGYDKRLDEALAEIDLSPATQLQQDRETLQNE
jgi:hypothetical protein